jgi:hypothetical protein
MQRFSWLHKRMTGGPPTRRASARKPNARFRPQLNTLERRELLSFSAPVSYTLNGPQALVTADVNGDGKSDLISLVNGGLTIAVQLANANGSFGSAFDCTPASGYTGTALAVSVEPGLPPEIVVATNPGDQGSFGATDSLDVLQFSSSNGFTGRQDIYGNIFPTDSPIASLALADVNPNFPGLLYAVAADASNVYVAPVAPQGEAPPAQTYAFPHGGYSPIRLHVAVGDFNGDGQPDIVAAGDGYACVYLNNGNGSFAAPQTYVLTGSLTTDSVAVGDFNRDGKLDIVTANSDSTVSVLRNNGNGTFGAAQNYAIGGPGNSVAVGDFNHDGYLDVVTTGTEMDVLWNKGDGTFGAYQKVGPAGNNVVAADFNGDGFPDLAQIDANASPTLGTIDVVLNNADWMAQPLFSRLTPSQSITFGHSTNVSGKLAAT